MKRLARLLAVGMLAVTMTLPAQAGTDVEVSGEIRARLQFDKTSFDTSAILQHFGELRTRVGVAATVDDNTHAFVQLQDSRVLGGDDQFGSRASGGLNDGKNVDLHQTYIKVSRLFGEGWGMKAGRFEFVTGNHRVFGNVGWSNVGRSWDGGMLWCKKPDFKVNGFWLKAHERMNPAYHNDFDIFGLYGNITAMANSQLDLFGFYEFDADTLGYATGINRLDRLNVGLYYYRTHGRFDFTANGVYQFGTQPGGTPTIVGGVPLDTIDTELDIAALMFAFEAGYTFPGTANARVGAGIDYASGDDGKDPTKFNAYNNLYYTGHKFRGYMDYFVPSNFEGLMDIMLRGKLDPTPGWTIKGDVHYFSMAKDYISPVDSATTKDVGIEIDLTITTTRVAGVTFDAGASLFMPQEAFAGFDNPDPGFWAYTMATVNFGK